MPQNEILSNKWADQEGAWSHSFRKYLPAVGQEGNLSAALQVLCSIYLCVTMPNFQKEVRIDHCPLLTWSNRGDHHVHNTPIYKMLLVLGQRREIWPNSFLGQMQLNTDLSEVCSGHEANILLLDKDW